MKLPDHIEKLTKLTSKFSQIASITDKFGYVPPVVQQMNDFQRKFQGIIPTFEIPQINFPKFDLPEFKPIINAGLLEAIANTSKIFEELKRNPEMHFAFITDLEILNLKSAEELKDTLINDLSVDDLNEKEEILNENLIPYLKRWNLDVIWLGANYALNSNDNPDKLRHCLTSLRTILEYLIDHKLAPRLELKDVDLFKKEFKNYHAGKEPLELVRINRAKKIEYFTSKIKFGMLEEFTKKEISYICDCYSILCNIHSPVIGISENQIRCLKVKTGITIWLLAYIYDVLNQE